MNNKKLYTKVKKSLVKIGGKGKCLILSMGIMMGMLTPMQALAFGDSGVTISEGEIDAATMMGKIIGMLLTITRYIGVALVVYGVYEVVMSFTNDQPEKKVKGITLALAGIIMAALKSVLTNFGIIS